MTEQDAVGRSEDYSFDPPVRFVPIDDAARNAGRVLVRSGGMYAAAKWTGDFWSEPYGNGPMQPDHPVQLDFEPVEWAPEGRRA